MQFNSFPNPHPVEAAVRVVAAQPITPAVNKAMEDFKKTPGFDVLFEIQQKELEEQAQKFFFNLNLTIAEQYDRLVYLWDRARQKWENVKSPDASNEQIVAYLQTEQQRIQKGMAENMACYKSGSAMLLVFIPNVLVCISTYEFHAMLHWEDVVAFYE
jgi:hypothetical protein